MHTYSSKKCATKTDLSRIEVKVYSLGRVERGIRNVGFSYPHTVRKVTVGGEIVGKMMSWEKEFVECTHGI